MHYNKAMFILEPTPVAQGLARKKVDVCEYPDGRLEIQHEGEVMPKSTRPMVFSRGVDAVEAPVYDRSMLGAGARFTGPAVVEERETTSVIRPGWDVEVAADGSLIASRTVKESA